MSQIDLENKLRNPKNPCRVLLQIYLDYHDTFYSCKFKIKIQSKNEILEKQIISLNDKNLSLEKEIIKLKIESQNFIEKMKVKDVETSSQIAYDSNLLVNENKELKLKVENLNKILTNFTNGKKNLDNLLGSQRCVFDKAGIGYNSKIKEKHYKKFSLMKTS